MSELLEVGWPIERLGAMLAALAPMSDERHSVAGAAPTLRTNSTRRELYDQLGRWLEHHAGELGVELEPIQVELGELEDSLPRLGPALLLVGQSAEARRVLVLERGGRKHVRVLGPDLVRHRVSVDALARMLAEPIVAPMRAGCDAILDAAQIPEARRERARQALLRRRAALDPIEGIWQLRLPPEAPLYRQLQGERVPRAAALTIGAHLVHHALLLLAWWLIGRGILQGRSDLGWLFAWALVLLSIVPLRAAQSWYASVAALRIGAVLKRRLLAGVLELDTDYLRSRGIGRLLALVIESEAVESLAISTGLIGATALIDLAMAGWVLTRGAGGGVLAVLLLVWVLVIGLLAGRYTKRRIGWARARLTMTHALVERMVGHTTRLAQEPVERWHEREDAATSSYLAHSRVMDRLGASLDVLAPRGWTLIAVLGMWPLLVVETPTTATRARAACRWAR
jgi:ATP-binding cassette subfamily B protein